MVRIFVVIMSVLLANSMFSQYNIETDTYTLQDDDVVVENGVILSCSTDADDWGTGKLVIPDVINGSGLVGIADGTKDNNVFGGKKITELYLPAKIKKIGSYSFSENNIILIDWANNVDVKRIASYAFSDNKLRDVTIPSTVSFIGKFAFNGNRLTDVRFEEGSFIRVIKGKAFNNNAGLTEIRLPANLNPGFQGYQLLDFGVEMDRYVDSFSDFNYSVVALLPLHVITPLDVELGGSGIKCYVGSHNNIYIPEYIDGVLIKTLEENSSFGNFLGTIVLPNSIDSIKRGAIFENNIKELTIPQNLHYVEKYGIAMYLDSVIYKNHTSLSFIEKGEFPNGPLPSPVIREGAEFLHWELSSGQVVDEIYTGFYSYIAQFAEVDAYNISGSISIDNIAGTSLILEGDFEGTRYPDSDGNFDLLLNEGRTMTITPKKEGYIFTPASKEISNLSSDLDDLHFIAEKSENIISGEIEIDDASDIYLQISGDYYAAVKVNDDGTYSFPVNQGRNIKIMPLKDGYVFQPESIEINNAVGEMKGKDFKTGGGVVSVSGTVEIDNHEGLIIKTSGDMNKTVSVNEGGVFSLKGYSNTSVALAPVKAGYTFFPETVTVDLLEEDQNNIVFTSHRKSFTVSGNINLASIDGIELEISGDSSFVQPLDVNGDFEFSLLARKSITITPTKEGIVFSPKTIVIEDLQGNEENKNFVLNTGTATDVTCSITVSPNPTKGTVIIQSAEMIEAITLISQDGKTLLTSKVYSNKHYLDVSSYAGRAHYLKVETVSGTYNGIVVKQ